ncbi:uncharacterized protein PADG_11797 [Paracoccidioides brasiliensis Pb18]|uniref:Uncharacterized protein n=1 Tax=Paracoccidioides brasiliensis (strain Pb18) TaxID=502780 RepID=A0A0A0HX61_PARBD|nr:uncharacterized protein PADG_11797 [Paracoccidioides brasiliensis Pb18]KGM92010.1 hypothetical protein PADG_11797 [Paracoccidioides brasiliensis Pb18]
MLGLSHRPLLTKLLCPGIRYAWTGSTGKVNSLEQSKRGDTTNPMTRGSTSGLKEKEEEAQNGSDKSKSQAITEQNHENSTKKTKKEFPEAPDPIIGMTDERGKVVLKVLEKNAT